MCTLVKSGRWPPWLNHLADRVGGGGGEVLTLWAYILFCICLEMVPYPGKKCLLLVLLGTTRGCWSCSPTRKKKMCRSAPPPPRPYERLHCGSCLPPPPPPIPKQKIMDSPLFIWWWLFIMSAHNFVCYPWLEKGYIMQWGKWHISFDY